MREAGRGAEVKLPRAGFAGRRARTRSAVLAGALLCLPAHARAAPPAPPSSTPEDADTVAAHGVDILLSGLLSFGVDLGLASYWRTSPTVGIGLSAGYLAFPYSSDAMYRVGVFNVERVA